MEVLCTGSTATIYGFFRIHVHVLRELCPFLMALKPDIAFNQGLLTWKKHRTGLFFPILVAVHCRLVVVVVLPMVASRRGWLLELEAAVRCWRKWRARVRRSRRRGSVHSVDGAAARDRNLPVAARARRTAAGLEIMLGPPDMDPVIYK
jgi:hypothetical protein